MLLAMQQELVVSKELHVLPCFQQSASKFAAIPIQLIRLTILSMKELSQALHHFHRRSIKLSLVNEAIVKQRIKTPRIRILGMRLIEMMELVRKLLKGHILQLLAGIQSQRSLVLGRILVPQVNLVL